MSDEDKPTIELYIKVGIKWINDMCVHDLPCCFAKARREMLCAHPYVLIDFNSVQRPCALYA